MPGVVELVDRAVALPPGPELAATLAELAWSEIPNARLVEVLQARSRQLAHEQARLLAGLAEIARAIPVADLPADDPHAVERPDSDAADSSSGDQVSPGGMKADVEPAGEDDRAPVDRAQDGKESVSVRPTGESPDRDMPGRDMPGRDMPGRDMPGRERPDRGMPSGTGEDRWAGERVGIREGMELRVGLATLLGCDERLGEIPGLGPVDADIARIVVTRHTRGAEWQFGLTIRAS